MQNHRHSCFWRSKHQSEGTRKNRQILELKITGAEVVDVKATVVPIVAGALGAVSEELENHLKTIGIPIVTSCKLLTENSIARNSFHPKEGP